jgi:molybdate transport system regulatory protein
MRRNRWPDVIGMGGRMFRNTHPLVDAARGGAKGGGAGLTQTGHEVLAHYRSLEVIMAEAGADRIEALRAMLGDMSGRK